MQNTVSVSYKTIPDLAVSWGWGQLVPFPLDTEGISLVKAPSKKNAYGVTGFHSL